MTTIEDQRELALWSEREQRERSLQEAFMGFHVQNPHVYQRLVDKARRWKAAGHSRCSIKMLWENLRFEEGLRTTDMPDERERRTFRLNNNYHSRYARLIMRTERDLAGFFEMRELKSAE